MRIRVEYLLFRRFIMNNEFREDSTPSIAKDEVNDEFEILLSCVGMDLLVLALLLGLGSAISLFHNHEVYTLEDFLSRSREEILSCKIILNLNSHFR